MEKWGNDCPSDKGKEGLRGGQKSGTNVGRRGKSALRIGELESF